ncbi:MAG TPA: DUF4124 domain-containing protein [Burkholderiales bacterium]|nr:DUF4124 domain-containing protein [Burkholderiales bacterium]
MNFIAKFCIAASASLLCAQAAAQTMHKCKDSAGKLTYADSECNRLGLTPAGEVTGRITVQPAFKVPPPAPGGPPPEVAKPNPAPPAKAAPAEGGEAVVGQDGRRCFKTAKGERCNDATTDQ